MIRRRVAKFRIIICLSIIFVFVYFRFIDDNDDNAKSRKQKFVDNILGDDPNGDKNIFFINTSDVGFGIDLQPRQACAIESAGLGGV